MSEPMTEERLAELEREVKAYDSISPEPVLALIAEIRRLRAVVDTVLNTLNPIPPGDPSRAWGEDLSIPGVAAKQIEAIRAQRDALQAEVERVRLESESLEIALQISDRAKDAHLRGQREEIARMVEGPFGDDSHQGFFGEPWCLARLDHEEKKCPCWHLAQRIRGGGE